MKEALLTVDHLSKYFPVYSGLFSRKSGDVRAVEDVSFHIDKGEIFGLVGESGCGKSTTGRSILRLLEPSAGKVIFAGHTLFDGAAKIQMSPKELMPLRQKMQIIFQDPYASLNPRRKAGDSILEGVLKHKLMERPQAERFAKDLLLRCGLHEESFGKYPHEFSGGQRQRICIARALALRPEFVVGDEPIAALDVSIQAQILKLLQELIREFNLTFLFISHDLHVVRYFCDRLAVMYLGSFVESGSSEALFANPLHPYSRALLSAIPSEKSDKRKRRIILTGDVPSPVNPPSGCKFHPRCPYAMALCTAEAPQLRKQSCGNAVACHLYP